MFTHPGLSTRQRLAILDSVKMSALAIRQFCNSIILRIRGVNLTGQGQAGHNTRATHKLHIFIIPSTYLELVGMLLLLHISLLPQELEQQVSQLTHMHCQGVPQKI